MLPLILNVLVASLSLGTATGIFLHDMHIDKAAVAAFNVVTPAPGQSDSGVGVKSLGLAPDLHPHAERHPLSQALHDLRVGQPQIQPRSDGKKHLLQKHAPRGHHPFDNYNLPIL